MRVFYYFLMLSVISCAIKEIPVQDHNITKDWMVNVCIYECDRCEPLEKQAVEQQHVGWIFLFKEDHTVMCGKEGMDITGTWQLNTDHNKLTITYENSPLYIFDVTHLGKRGMTLEFRNESQDKVKLQLGKY